MFLGFYLLLFLSFQKADRTISLRKHHLQKYSIKINSSLFLLIKLFQYMPRKQSPKHKKTLLQFYAYSLFFVLLLKGEVYQ